MLNLRPRERAEEGAWPPIFWPLIRLRIMKLKRKNLIFLLVLAGATIFMYFAILWKVGSG